MTWKPKKKSRRILRAAVITAACIVILCGAASAFGFDILQAFADWTAETFGFVTPGQEEAEAPQDDPYNTLRLAVSERTDLPVVPTWFPEDTELVGSISVVEQIGMIRLQGTFENSQEQFTIRIQIYDSVPEKYDGTYQIDSNSFELYEVDGITYYLMSNNDTNSVAWLNGVVEGHIQGHVSFDGLKKMVDSIQ